MKKAQTRGIEMQEHLSAFVCLGEPAMRERGGFWLSPGKKARLLSLLTGIC